MLLNLPGAVWIALIGLAALFALAVAIIWVAYRYLR
jgi:hypothetical protein